MLDVERNGVCASVCRLVRLPAIGLVLLTAMLAGCIDPPKDYAPTEADVFVEENQDFDYLWDMTLRVLRRRGLTPDRQDRREGVITTLPITCQQWFEFWRHDAMGPYQWAESSMHTVQRLAIIRIKRLPEPGRFRVNVRVDVFRFSAPERQVTTPSGALLMYSEKLPTEEGELYHPNVDIHWVRLGRDPYMEGVLLRRILSHYPGGYQLVEAPDQPPEEDTDVESEAGRPEAPPEEAEGPPSPGRGAPLPR